MQSPSPHITQDDARAALFAGITAYTIWGFFPIYFVATRDTSPLEILCHRVVWSIPFGLLIIIARKQWQDVVTALKTRKVMLLLTLSSVAMAANWGIYIWAIQQGQIFQGSLGYYINPLMYVLVGVVFFKDKLSKLQTLAILLACIGVLVLTVYGGMFPAISLFLAVSFTIYGVVRKQVDVASMPGLLIETLILLPPALIYLVWLFQNGGLVFGQTTGMTALLVMAGPITVLPLLAFAFAAKKLTLSTLGFLQYIGPTLQFACGVYYGEAFTIAHAWCFGFIWTAVAIFMWDGLRGKPATMQ